MPTLTPDQILAAIVRGDDETETETGTETGTYTPTDLDRKRAAERVAFAIGMLRAARVSGIVLPAPDASGADLLALRRALRRHPAHDDPVVRFARLTVIDAHRYLCGAGAVEIPD